MTESENILESDLWVEPEIDYRIPSTSVWYSKTNEQNTKQQNISSSPACHKSQEQRRQEDKKSGPGRRAQKSEIMQIINTILYVHCCCAVILGCYPCQATKLLTEAILQAETLQEHQLLTYGVDVSFPMHHSPSMSDGSETDNYDITGAYSDKSPLEQFTHDRLDYYNNHFLRGCADSFGEELCLRSERERIEMSKRQPPTMRNMTKGLGFHKTKVPKDMFEMLLDFWNNNRQEARTEEWSAGSTYFNHWESAPTVVRVDNETLEGVGHELTQTVWDGLRPIISHWTGQELQEASMYGIRIYHTDAVLATHVDRNPLVSSAIINVAQDVDEPWCVILREGYVAFDCCPLCSNNSLSHFHVTTTTGHWRSSDTMD